MLQNATTWNRSCVAWCKLARTMCLPLPSRPGVAEIWNLALSDCLKVFLINLHSSHLAFSTMVWYINTLPLDVVGRHFIESSFKAFWCVQRCFCQYNNCYITTHVSETGQSLLHDFTSGHSNTGPVLNKRSVLLVYGEDSLNLFHFLAWADSVL